jgi:hypothetical protein
MSVVAASRLRSSPIRPEATSPERERSHRARAASVGASIALLSIGFVLLLSSSAHAATVSQRAYGIFINEFRQQVAYSSAQLQSELTATETKLASCATAVDAVSSTHIDAAEALSDELEDQYTADVAIGIDQPALSAFTSLAKLGLPRAEHKQALAAETIMHRLLTLNTCADLTRWQAAAFSSSSEPPNTNEFRQPPLAVNLPAVDVIMTLPTSESSNYNKQSNEAGQKTTAVYDTIGNDWMAWSQGFGF